MPGMGYDEDVADTAAGVGDGGKGWCGEWPLQRLLGGEGVVSSVGVGAGLHGSRVVGRHSRHTGMTVRIRHEKRDEQHGDLKREVQGMGETLPSGLIDVAGGCND